MQGFIGDQTPLGELAHWISQDRISQSMNEFLITYLVIFTKITTLDHEFLEIVKRSISLYEQSQ